MSILSPLLGEDFVIKEGYNYVTRLLTNNDMEHSRLKIIFPSEINYPFELFIRTADQNGKAIHGTEISRELILGSSSFIFFVPSQEKLLLIFAYKIEDLPENMEEFKLEYEIEYMELGNQIVTDMYMFETARGIPYQPHSAGSYSEFEFAQKIPWKGFSDHLNKTAVSRMVIGHTHENERGYIDRVYILPRRGRTHGSMSVKNKSIQDKEQTYIYLDPLWNTKHITSNSNNVLRAYMFQMSDIPSAYGRIVFKFFAEDNGEIKYVLNDDERDGVTIATCRAKHTIIKNNTLYGLDSEYSDNPLIIRLEPDETYREGLFKYKPVIGNFLITFKGRSNVNVEQVINIPPIEIKETNVPSLSHSADLTIVGPDENNMLCIWYLINPEHSITLYPKFEYSLQNFQMQPEQFVKYEFFYELLKNYFTVMAVFENDITREIKTLYEFHGGVLELRNTSDTTVTNIPNIVTIKEYIKFPPKFPDYIFKYNDTIVFPSVKLAELQHNKINNIPIKYKWLTAWFQYQFIEIDDNNIITNHEISAMKEYGKFSIHTYLNNDIPNKIKATSSTNFNYEYHGYQHYQDFDNSFILGKPLIDLYTETINGDEIFIYKFLYKVIKGRLTVYLVDENNDLLDLTLFKEGTSPVSHGNPFVSDLIPNPSYSIKPLLKKNNVETYIARQTGTLQYIAEVQGENRDETVIYDVLKNKFIINATNKTNNTTLKKLTEIDNCTYLNIETKDPSIIPDMILLPDGAPTSKFKYDDPQTFPLTKETIMPQGSTQIISLKYREIIAKFIYEFICEEDNVAVSPKITNIGYKDTFDIATKILTNIGTENKNYEFINQYKEIHNNQTINGPTANIITESNDFDEEFKWQFLYKLIKGQLTITLRDQNDSSLLNLEELKYNNILIDNNKQIGIVGQPRNYQNSWTTPLLPKITYQIMDWLEVNENVGYELVSPINNNYIFFPTIDNSLDSVELFYKRVVVNPELQITYGASGCNWSNGYRGAFVDRDTGIVVGTISSQGSTLTYNINTTIFKGVNIIQSPGLFSIQVDIQDPSRDIKTYDFYLWNVENGRGGSDPHTCNGFSLDYFSIEGTVNKTYPNNKYDYNTYQVTTGQTFSNPGLTPVLIIKTGENSTSTCFDIRL